MMLCSVQVYKCAVTLVGLYCFFDGAEAGPERAPGDHRRMGEAGPWGCMGPKPPLQTGEAALEPRGPGHGHQGWPGTRRALVVVTLVYVL